ncbi:MAG: TetR/AcrR family transcriptional regulator [Armatimonadetes bacterium]|nr:TetR/AcrR family transcriptional regulator [Armatimonadota bacterium]
MPDDIIAQPQNSWKERRKQQLREELVATALELFEEHGCDAPSVDEIAARAGIAKGTFYLYFKTKADIVQAVLEKAIDEMEKCVARAVDRSPEDARVALKSVIGAQLSFFEEHPGMVSLLLDGRGLAGLELSPDAQASLLDRRRAATVLVSERIIRKGMLQTHYREIDAHIAVRALHGMVAALVDEAVLSGSSLAGIAEVAVELFEKGAKRGA